MPTCPFSRPVHGCPAAYLPAEIMRPTTIGGHSSRPAAVLEGWHAILPESDGACQVYAVGYASSYLNCGEVEP
jgi:hypothetical protein